MHGGRGGRGGGGGPFGRGAGREGGAGSRSGGRGGAAHNPFAAQQQQTMNTQNNNNAPFAPQQQQQQQQPQQRQQYQQNQQRPPQPSRAANPFGGPTSTTSTSSQQGFGGGSGRTVFASNQSTGSTAGFQKSGGGFAGSGGASGKSGAVAAKNPFAQSQSQPAIAATATVTAGSLFAPNTAGLFAQPQQQQQGMFRPPLPSQPAPAMGMTQQGFAAPNPFQSSASVSVQPAASSVFGGGIAASSSSSSSFSSNPFSIAQTPSKTFGGFMKSSNNGFAPTAGAATLSAPPSEQAVKENLKTIDFKAVLGVHKEEENIDSAVHEEDLVISQEPVHESKADDALNFQSWMESFPLKHLSEDAPQGSVFDFLQGDAFVAGKIPTCVPRCLR